MKIIIVGGVAGGATAAARRKAPGSRAAFSETGRESSFEEGSLPVCSRRLAAGSRSADSVLSGSRRRTAPDAGKIHPQERCHLKI